MEAPIRVTHVDDDEDLLELTATFLERSRPAFEVESTTDPAEVLAAVEAGRVDCVVTDYEMGDADGLALLESVTERDPTVPVVLFTGKGSEEIASEAISAGVTDYLRKGTGTDQYEVLANRIENAVATRRAERARRESERKLRRYRTLVEAVGDPMFVLDADGTIEMVNDAMAETMGRTPEGMVGRHVTAFVSCEAFERATAELRSGVESGDERRRVEFAFENADGDERVGEAHVTALTDDAGAVEGSVGVVRDVTRREERERELAQYESIVETAPIGLFVLDGDGRITWMNEEFHGPLEEDAADLEGESFRTLVERGYFDESVVETYLENVRRLLSADGPDETVVYEVRKRVADGEDRIYETHTGLLPVADGEFRGTVNVFRDVTRRKRYRNELERQNERLEKFVGLVSHDLRNPLNVARGYLDLHDAECESDALADVEWALDRMETLIEELLSLARHGRSVGEVEPVDLGSVVADAWAAVDTADATLERSVDRTIRADRGRLSALLENLFRNAVQHGGDDVVVSVDELDDVPTAVRVEPDDETDDATAWGFSVEDDGSGLPDEDAFELGYTTADDGTGFGLGIVSEIADAHGWHVTACDGRDGGARFEIRGVTPVEEGAAE